MEPPTSAESVFKENANASALYIFAVSDFRKNIFYCFLSLTLGDNRFGNQININRL